LEYAIFSFKRPILVTERFLNSLVKDYGKHSLSTDRGTWYIHTLVNSWEDRTSYIHLTYEKKKHHYERTIHNTSQG
jgi:hypothetical protein